MDPKSFYNKTMPEKQGSDYEHARWHADPFLSAQYEMMKSLFKDSISGHVKGAKDILEIGPGPGTWTKEIRNIAPDAQLTLLDISKEMLARAKKNLGEQNIVFIEGDFIESKNIGSFDLIFSSRAIEYMEDKSILVKKLWEQTKEGGSVALITKTPKPLLNKIRGRKLSKLHQGQVSVKKLQSLMKGVGFVVSKTRIATATAPGISSPLLNKIIFSLLKNIPLFSPLTIFSESYLLICKKPS